MWIGAVAVVLQEILAPSLVHILTFDIARSILSEMRRQLMNNQFQRK